jgi:hypothetical protein
VTSFLHPLAIAFQFVLLQHLLNSSTEIPQASMATTFSPFLITAYTSLLATSLQKTRDLSSYILEQKSHGRSRLDLTLSEINDVIAKQNNVDIAASASECGHLNTKRTDLGKSVAGVALLDAALDNYIFTVNLLGKKVEKVERQLVRFGSGPTKKMSNGVVTEGKGCGKVTKGDDKNRSEKWVAVMEMVQQIVSEIGRVAGEIEGIVKVEGDDNSDAENGFEVRDEDGEEDEDSMNDDPNMK